MSDTTDVAASAASELSEGRPRAGARVHARADPARGRDDRGPRAGHRPPARRSTPPSPRSRPGPRRPRSSGAASTRCCSGSSACSGTSAPCSATAPSSTTHQVDALSGTLAAITGELESPEGEARRNGRGNGNGASKTADEAPAEAATPTPNGEAELDADDVLEPDEEPQDWEEPADADAEAVAEAPEDPGASRRFWFEHATGAGKTVAAVGFVEASRTGGVLILTHRRNLVDQFIGEISDRGYKERLSPAAARRLRQPLRAGHGRDLPVVRAQRGAGLGRLLDRDLRRGPHRARREDERLHPRAGPGRCSSA